MNNNKAKLLEAEQKALQLFDIMEHRGLICPGKTEEELNDEVFQLAKELFGIEKYWHKRIIRGIRSCRAGIASWRFVVW